MAVDWLKIKTEYINDQSASYRKLAEKYGVNKDTIACRAQSEGWKTLRKMQTDNIQTKTIQKTAEIESEIAAIKSRVGLQLMQKIEETVQTLPSGDADKLRKMVQSYKDMCEIKQESKLDDKDVVKVIWDV